MPSHCWPLAGLSSELDLRRISVKMRGTLGKPADLSRRIVLLERSIIIPLILERRDKLDLSLGVRTLG